MALARFKIENKEFVIISRRTYERLTRIEQNQKDAEIARRGIEAYRSGKAKVILHEELVQKLGRDKSRARKGVLK